MFAGGDELNVELTEWLVEETEVTVGEADDGDEVEVGSTTADAEAADVTEDDCGTSVAAGASVDATVSALVPVDSGGAVPGDVGIVEPELVDEAVDVSALVATCALVSPIAIVELSASDDGSSRSSFSTSTLSASSSALSCSSTWSSIISAARSAASIALALRSDSRYASSCVKPYARRSDTGQ